MPIRIYLPSHRIIIVTLLGFSSGLPFALCGSTLQIWFAQEQVDILTVSFLSLVGQPYAYKFFWSPLLDKFKPPFLSRYRGWILFCQIIIILLILILIFFNPSQHTYWMIGIAFLMAFFSASQDIVIDAYRTEILEVKERGLGCAFSVEGYRMAMLLSGSAALVMADHIGWKMTYFWMLLAMLLGVFVVIFAPEPRKHYLPLTLKQSTLGALRDMSGRQKAWAFLGIVLLYRLMDAFTSSSNALTSIFMLNELQMSLTEVGFINKIVGMIASMVGISLGGFLMLRFNIYQALLYFGILHLIPNGLFFLLSLMGKNYYLITITILFENVIAGMSTAVFVAFLTSLCNQHYTAFQYALLSSLAAMGRVYLVPVGGLIIQLVGWQYFYLFTMLMVLPVLSLLIYAKKEIGALDLEKVKN